MNDKIHLDGSSPLSHYLMFLHDVPTQIEKRLARDYLARNILTGPGLPVVLKREHDLFWARNHEKNYKRKRTVPRVWTRKDELWINLENGYTKGNCGSGFYPKLRTRRYTDRIGPLNDRLFRDSVNEARNDRFGESLASLLNEANETISSILHLAYNADADWKSNRIFRKDQLRLQGVTSKLLKWTKSPMQASQQNDSVESAKTLVKPKQTVVDVSVLIDELSHLVGWLRLSLSATDEKSKRHNKRLLDLHSKHVNRLLGDWPDIIIANSGRSLTTCHLQELWWEVPRPERPEHVPCPDVLQRWLVLIEESESTPGVAAMELNGEPESREVVKLIAALDGKQKEWLSIELWNDKSLKPRLRAAKSDNRIRYDQVKDVAETIRQQGLVHECVSVLLSR